MSLWKIQLFEEADGFERFFGGLLGIEAQVFQHYIFAAPFFGKV
jgi:hypothetical protein